MAKFITTLLLAAVFYGLTAVALLVLWNYGVVLAVAACGGAIAGIGYWTALVFAYGFTTLAALPDSVRKYGKTIEEL